MSEKTSYESKIIQVNIGSFNTIHDYCRLDLDYNNKTFTLHSYYIYDSHYQRYCRETGQYQFVQSDNIKYYWDLILTVEKCFSIRDEQVEDEYYESLKCMDLDESTNYFDKMSDLMINLKEKHLEAVNGFEPEKVFHSNSLNGKGRDEIFTNLYPFDDPIGIYKKIRLEEIIND